MIKISDGKIYVDGEPTTNPELIGLAVLDSLEKQKETLFNIKMKYFQYVRENNLRDTIERRCILDFIISNPEFNNVKTILEAFDKSHKNIVSRATFYNAIKLFVDAEIIEKRPQIFILADYSTNQLN